MLPRLMEDARQAIGTRARFFGVSIAVDVVIGLLAVVSLFFFTLAAYSWAQVEYGPIGAAFAFGLLFLALAVVVFIAARIRSRRYSQAATANPTRYLLGAERGSESGSEWLVAPVGIATGIEILRKIGARRLIPAFALTAVVIAALAARTHGAAQANPKK